MAGDVDAVQFLGAGVLAMTAKTDSDVWIFSVHNPLTQAVLLANWNGSSWTTSPSPIPADSSVSIGSAVSSPSHVWLFGSFPVTAAAYTCARVLAG